MYRLAIFDFDGTVADSFPCFIAAINEAAARYGFRAVGPGDLGRLRALGPWDVLEQLEIPLWQLPMITQHVRHLVGERLEAVHLFPGMHEVLEDLAARGVAMAVVSSNGERAIRHVLGARLASLVRDYRCDVSMFGKRPRLRQALAAGGVRPDEAIAIGDELRDLKAAHAEGIAFGAVTWGFTQPSALRAAGPDLVFERVEEIAPAVTGRASRPLRA